MIARLLGGWMVDVACAADVLAAGEPARGEASGRQGYHGVLDVALELIERHQ